MWLIKALIVIILAGNLLTLLPTPNWIIDLNNSHSFYYLGIDFFLLLLFKVLGEDFRYQLCPEGAKPLVYSFVLLIAYYLVQLIPVFDVDLSTPAWRVSAQQATPLRVLFVTLDRENKSKLDLRAIQKDIKLDLLAFTSIGPLPEIEGFNPKEYAFQIQSRRKSESDLYLFSRIKIQQPVTTSLGKNLAPVLIAQLETTSRVPVQISLFRLGPNYEKAEFYRNWLLVRRLATQYRHSSNRELVLADLGTTPYSNLYRLLSSGASMTNALAARSQGSVLDLTALNGLLNFQHVFTKSAMSIQRFEAVQIAGLRKPALFIEALVP